MDSIRIENDNQEMTEREFPLLDGDTNEKGETSNGKGPPVEKEIEAMGPKPLIYRVNENPPIHLTIIFALQQLLLVMASPMGLTLIIAEIVCMQSDELLQLQVLSSLMFITGVSTVLMSTFGVRLPIYQGGAKSYIIPLLAMTTVKEWACPETFKQLDPLTNKTILMVSVDNGTLISARDLALGKISQIFGVFKALKKHTIIPSMTIINLSIAQLSGSLMAVGGVHFLIGLTGFVGFIVRYIGPVTIVPTIVMIGLNIYKMVVKFMEPHMGISFVVIISNLVFSLLLRKKLTPLPWWSKEKGFHIFWYPLHSVLSILFSMMIGWMVSGIMTRAGLLTDDPEDKGYLARSDARDFVIDQTDWFIIPYPGQFGSFSIDPGVFVNFLIASLLSVLDSIGDYAAAAKTARVTPPPHYAFNRGIAIEGLMSFFAGALGSCTATVSFGANIGAMGITRVVSRRVFQVMGFLFIICSVVGKIGAFFITIPYPVLGGITLITIGLLIGVVLSYLQTIDLRSTRNLAIIGISMLSGLVLPYWVSRNGDSINTGNRSVDVIIQMLLANPSLIAGVFSCFMDNLVPGTLKERGIVEQMKDLDEAEESIPSAIDNEFYEDGPEIYRIPFLPQSIRRSHIARRLLPIFDYESPVDTS